MCSHVRLCQSLLVLLTLWYFLPLTVGVVGLIVPLQQLPKGRRNGSIYTEYYQSSYHQEAQQEQQQHSSPKASPNDNENHDERTLYEVLGGSPEMTRAQLKQCYVELARRSHPDAKIGGYSITVNDNDDDNTLLDFGQIADAWRILGNPKSRRRYDRELKAKEWSVRAQDLTNKRLEQGFGVASTVMDNLAVPFLRRTTATTIAIGQALAGLNSNKNNNINRSDNEATTQGRQRQAGQVKISETFLSAIEAGQEAGRAIDSMELNEKSAELEARAKMEQERAAQIAQELGQVTEQRLFATLQSPNVALTSDEAQTILERLAVEDTVSLVDRAMLKTTVENEIANLRDTEEQFSEKLMAYEETDRQWNVLLTQQEDAKSVLLDKKSLEIEARKALEMAQQGVVEAKEELVQTSNDLRGVEHHVRKTAQEMDKITNSLTRRQEKVRDALRKKTEMMQAGIQVMYLSDDELAALRRREVQLMSESQEAQNMVARLQSRADKLKMRAEALENWRNDN